MKPGDASTPKNIGSLFGSFASSFKSRSPVIPSSSVLSSDTVASLEGANISGGEWPTMVSKPVGRWPAANKRSSLVGNICWNLTEVVNTPKGPERTQFQREINLYWKCLSEREKVTLLQRISEGVMLGEFSPTPTPEQLISFGLPGTFPKMTREEGKVEFNKLSPDQRKQFIAQLMHGPAISWLHSMLANMKPKDRNDLFKYLTPDARSNINRILTKKPNKDWIDIAGLNHKHIVKYRHPDGYLGVIPLNEDGSRKRVAIIGTGVAGTIAALEILRAGGIPVIIEAADHVGGRLEARHFREVNGEQAPEFAELGGMRFPPGAFRKLLEENGIDTKSVAFPNPGTVSTKLLLGETVIDWPVGAPAPNSDLLKKVKHDFERFGASLMGPLDEARASHNTDKMIEIWQNYATKYSGKSFYDAVKEGMEAQGTKWTQDHTYAFGALGLGTGGFRPLFPDAFVGILQIMVNRLDENQILLPKGTTAALNSFYEKEVTDPHDGAVRTLAGMNCVRLNTEVTAITSNDGKPTVQFRTSGGEGTQQEVFDGVLLTGTPGAWEKIAGLSVDRKISKQPVLSDGVAGALPHIHMTPSSKMFVLTKTKFWRDADGNPRPDIPPVILTDKGPCATYCLNYPHSDRGVVVVSYTWGDDSNKVMNTPTAQRLAEFIKVIREVSPEFARHLEEDTIDIIVVDWQKERSQGFALPYPGQEPNPQQLYYQYQSVMPNSGQPNSRVYLIAPLYDGWANSPANGAVNASLAFIQESGGGDTIVDKSPLTHKPKINYG